jgi:hypothetical protein
MSSKVVLERIFLNFLIHYLAFFNKWKHKVVASEYSRKDCAKSRKIDIYILHDVSSSMKIHKDEVKGIWYNFSANFLDKYENGKIAIGKFSDKDVRRQSEHTCYTHVLNFTRSKKDIYDVLTRSEKNFNGGDRPEDTLTSMAQASLNNRAGWRSEKNSTSDVISILLVITDAESHLCHYPTLPRNILHYFGRNYSFGPCYSNLTQPYSCAQDYYISNSAFKKALELRNVLPVMMLYDSNAFWNRIFEKLKMKYYAMNASQNDSQLQNTLATLLKNSLCYAEKKVFIPKVQNITSPEGKKNVILKNDSTHLNVTAVDGRKKKKTEALKKNKTEVSEKNKMDTSEKNKTELSEKNKTEISEKNKMDTSEKKAAKTYVVLALAAVTSVFALTSIVFLYALTNSKVSTSAYTGDFDMDENRSRKDLDVAGKILETDFINNLVT